MLDVEQVVKALRQRPLKKEASVSLYALRHATEALHTDMLGGTDPSVISSAILRAAQGDTMEKTAGLLSRFTSSPVSMGIAGALGWGAHKAGKLNKFLAANVRGSSGWNNVMNEARAATGGWATAHAGGAQAFGMVPNMTLKGKNAVRQANTLLRANHHGLFVPGTGGGFALKPFAKDTASAYMKTFSPDVLRSAGEAGLTSAALGGAIGMGKKFLGGAKKMDNLKSMAVPAVSGLVGVGVGSALT